MHELSIVQSMLDICEKRSGGNQISKIVVKIGKMSGIEPHFLKESFDIFKEDTLCSDALMQINLVDIKIRCNECDKESLVENYDFHCPNCKSSNTTQIAGQEMYIEYIELKDSQ